MNYSKGKKTKARQKGTSKLKKELYDKGIRGCEVKLASCTGAFTGALAHDDKGRFLSAEELANPDPMRCVIACSSCHHVMEYEMPRLEMQKLIREIASNRFSGKVGTLQMAKQKDSKEKKSGNSGKGSKKPAIPDICPKCKYRTFRLFSCPNCGERLVK